MTACKDLLNNRLQVKPRLLHNSVLQVLILFNLIYLYVAVFVCERSFKYFKVKKYQMWCILQFGLE